MSAERRSVGEHYAVGEIQTAHRDGSFVVVEVWVPLGEAGSVELGARVGIVPKAHLSDAQALSRAFGPATLYEAARLSGGDPEFARLLAEEEAIERQAACVCCAPGEGQWRCPVHGPAARSCVCSAPGLGPTRCTNHGHHAHTDEDSWRNCPQCNGYHPEDER